MKNIPIGGLLFFAVGLATLAFALGAVVFLLWAMVGRPSTVRSRRLRISFSSAILCLTALVLTISEYYLALLPSSMRALRPEFQPPYQSLSVVLAIIAPLFILALAGILVWALNRHSNHWKRIVILSICCSLIFLAAVGANYAIIYRVQVPNFDRYVMIESRDWKTHVGDSAPDFEVKMLDGSTARLADFRGKVLLLNFFATWCGPCLHELPHMQTIWNDAGGNNGFTMLIVGREETQDSVTSFKSKNKFTFPLAYDPDAAAFHKFADDGIPRTYLIGRDGTILYQTMGFADIDVYQRELASLRRIIDEQCSAVRAGR
jgi:peroxiredoxin